MLLKHKINKMIVLWIFVILAGTCLTIYGSAKFNDEWNKSSELRKSHTTPDFLFFDCEAEVELSETLRDSILKEVLPKISGLGKMDTVPLSIFFDEVGAENNKIQKENYSIDNSIYKNFSELKISGMLRAKDSSITLDLNSRNSNIKLSNKIDNSESCIEVRSYNSKTNKFKILYRNILLDIRSNSMSQFITDLDCGEMTLTMFTKSTLEIKEIKNIVFKTKKVEYFRVKELHENNLGQHKAKLILTLH